MSHGYTAHGEFQPDQVVTLPESKIFSEFEGPAQPDAAAPPSESANLSKDRRSPTDLQWHPVAELFPMPGGEEMAAMVADLKTNGLREPGKTWKGIGIDGRFRAAACQRAEVDFRTEEIDLPDEAAVIAYIMSRNIRRRQMSEAQRAVVAARMIPFYSEAAQKRMKAGKKANPKANLAEGEKGAVREVVAKLMNVSSGSVGNAARLLKHGCPELIQQVERGDVSISAAADVSELPKGQQSKIAETGKKGIQAKAKEIRASRKPSRQALDDANTDNKDPQDEPTSEITQGRSDAGHITPTRQITGDKHAEAQRGTEKHQVNPDQADWIISAIDSANLTGVTWVLLGQGTPPTSEWAANNGVMHFFVRPVAEKQHAPEKAPDMASASSEDKGRSEENPADAAPRKKCFGSHREYCNSWSDENSTPEACTACVHRAACANVTCGQKECFGNHPESPIVPDCLLCPDEMDCEKATHASPEQEEGATKRKRTRKKSGTKDWVARLYASVYGRSKYVATLDEIPATDEAWEQVRSAYWKDNYRRLFIRDNEKQVRWDTGKVF
jgi:hypothetical protein